MYGTICQFNNIHYIPDRIRFLTSVLKPKLTLEITLEMTLEMTFWK